MRGRDALFIAALALSTRALIAIAAFVTAPATSSGTQVPATLGGLERLSFFDGGWFASIVTGGYEFAPDGEEHNVAFFPLYPMLVRLTMGSGLSFAAAAVAVSNAAFVGALCVTFAWVRERCDAVAARWTVAMLCCCPLSLYAAVAYSEGLFLLLTALALRAFDARRFRAAALWIGLASATRLQAIAFAPGFVLAAIAERHWAKAWLAGLAPLGGGLGFALYCGWRFGDPLAFVHAQNAWRANPGFDATAWQNLVGAGLAQMPWLHVAALAAALALWRGRSRLPFAVRTGLALISVEAERWAWNGSEYILLLVPIAAIAALAFRRRLGPTATIMVLMGVGLIAFAGPPVSVPRIAYDFIPASFALALLYRKLPEFGLALLVVMTADLFWFTLDFAHAIFVS